MTDALKTGRRLSVAPMMDWTDRHCRFLHRLLTRHALLYTEMVTAAAAVHGPAERLLAYSPEEEPVALQLGGSEPDLLARAVRRSLGFGYREINLNVGCPSDRVQSGAFGACLMREPALVANCVRAMRDAAGDAAQITVKCRIGVDDQAPEEVLPAFIDEVSAAGVSSFAIHARKAWLQGLSPKDNREIPPLDYPLVHRMKAEFPDLHLSINGGIETLAEARDHLRVMDGVMLGRAAYHRPWDILGAADSLWGEAPLMVGPVEVAQAMRPYLQDHLAGGGRLHQVTRHMLGLFHGQPGARNWRRVLSEGASRGGIEVYDAALAQVSDLVRAD